MSKNNQLWKFSWNPSGYYVENNLIDLSKKYINNDIYLNHTYFNINKFLAYTYLSDGTKKFYKVHELLQSDTDLLFTGLDQDLTALAGTNVYSKLKLVSIRAQELNDINIDCNFLADVIDYKSLGQELNVQADVTHNSLSLKEKLIVPFSIMKNLEVDSLSGEFGSLSLKESRINSPNLILDNSVFITESGLLIQKESNTIRFGSENYNITFNTSKRNVSIKTGEKKEGILFRGPKLEEIPVYGIPVVMSDDITKLGFVPWLSLEPDKKRVKLGNINMNDSTIFQDNNFDFAKNYLQASMTICGIPFISIDKETNLVNLFGGIIKINLLNKDVIMNGFTFNPTFFNNILQMQKDINILKSKIH